MKKLSVLLIFTLAVIVTSCGPKPTSSFDYELTTAEAPLEIAFNNTSQNADTYFWDFGDGTSSTEANPKHMFYYGGTYNISLIASKNGQDNKSTKSITLRESAKRIVEVETEFGVMKIELFNFTPKHRDNFIKLAEEGYYDGTLFHRVMQGFMAQGGDPDSKNAPADKHLGQGGPGYNIPAEIVPGAYHYKGAVGAARFTGPTNPTKESAGSQFYIVSGTPNTPQQLQQYVNTKAQNGIMVNYSAAQVDFYGTQGGAPILDMDYTVFGQVVEGLHIIDEISTVSVGAANRPIKDIPMKVRVIK